MCTLYDCVLYDLVYALRVFSVYFLFGQFVLYKDVFCTLCAFLCLYFSVLCI